MSSDNKKIIVVEVGIGNPWLCRTRNTMGHENVELHLVEANPHTYNDLVSHFGHYSNVTLYNMAVADYNGEIEFVFDGDSSYVKGIGSPTEQCAPASYQNSLQVSKVPCIKFSEIDKGNIDELLLDIEAAEYTCLKHMISRPKKIVCELAAQIYRNPNYDKIMEWMKDNGYTFEGMDGDDGVFSRE